MLINVLLPSEYKHFTYSWVLYNLNHWFVQGDTRDVRLPLSSIFINFMQFLGKMAKIIDWRPHLVAIPVWEILDPPLLQQKLQQIRND